MTVRAACDRQVGTSQLWLVDRIATADQLADIEAATPRLSCDEVDRAASFADRQRACVWTAGRTALRLLLEVHCGFAIRQRPFARSTAGRPMVEGSSVDFSIADSGPYLLIAITSRGRIGVDIEQPRPLKMSPQRLDLVMAAGEGLGGSPVSPLPAWCRIEAFAKSVGPSLAATLARLGVQGHGAGPLTIADVRARTRQVRMDTGVDVEVADLTLPYDLVGAVAGPGPFPAVHPLDAAALTPLAR